MIHAVRLAALMLCVMPLHTLGTNRTITSTQLLSRKKRFLTFPTNSLLTLSACLAKGMLILSPPAFVFTLDFDLAFQLPNDTRTFSASRPYERIHRRDRRDLYWGMEDLLERQGLNGRACVLRALCETHKALSRGRGGLMEDIFHAMFSLPEDRESLADETEDDFRRLAEELRDHDTAHKLGRERQDCASLYSSCPVSLLSMALW